MKILLLFVVGFVGAVYCAPRTNFSLNCPWESFKETFDKVYEGHKNEIQRRMNWEKNIFLIDEHNRKADLGIYTYWLGVNEFADMTYAEFTDLMNGIVTSNDTYENASITFKNIKMDNLPKEIDWRKKGYVTEVKNQGYCGGCWAFSATGALEGQHFKNTGKLISLSEQEIIDCCLDDGCGGGLMDIAFNCIHDLGGIEPEKTYNFIGQNGKCHFNKSNVVATVNHYTTIEPFCEECLQYAVGTVGPVSTAIYSREETFHLYKSGVYQSDQCNETVNHGVLVVGYGTENGQDYWLIKNSWGPTWGMDGYIKVARNNQNMCGIATIASFPSE